MPSQLIIAEDTALIVDPYSLPFNPMQPRGLRSGQPSAEFPTLSGPGVIQSPKRWYPSITLTWPKIIRSIASHAELLSELRSRQYAKTGLDYYIGITGTKDAGFPFPGPNKYINIRIIEVIAEENPVDNDLDQVIFDLVVSAKWLDPPG